MVKLVIAVIIPLVKRMLRDKHYNAMSLAPTLKASASATECIRRLERENTLKRVALQAVQIKL
jgi:hypothetical protein